MQNIETMQFITVMYKNVDADFPHDVMGILGIKHGGPVARDVMVAIEELFPDERYEHLALEEFLHDQFGGDVEFVHMAGVVEV